MSDIAISVEGLGKQYRIGRKQPKYRTFRETLVDGFVGPFRRLGKLLRGQATGAAELDEPFWALKDISFEVKHGEVVGIIGRNGAGKSTLLKILAQITEPTTGFADIHGRVGSLLEVGTGFHPELTGRENVYLNGAILGMKKAEIERKFDEIVDFAEVEKFIDTPVKHYSSGMYLRLAFAVAAHLEPEILLVDEVLAVGDVTFQRKCLGKMGDVAKQGRTVLFVSHNTGIIPQLCGTAIWLEKGQMKLSGSSSRVVVEYLASAISGSSVWQHVAKQSCENGAELKAARILSMDGRSIELTNFDAPFQVEIEYEISAQIRNLSIVCRVSDSQGHIVWTSWDTDTTKLNGSVRKPGAYSSRCRVPGSWLRPGRYFLTIGAHVRTVKVYSWHENVLAFNVSDVGYPLNPDRAGILTPMLKWEVTRKPEK